MKVNTHPTYFENANVVCVCGNKFTVGSTRENIHIELCYKCHPFYTGEIRFVDSDNRIENFKKREKKAIEYKQVAIKKVAEEKQRREGPKSLREMLLGIK